MKIASWTSWGSPDGGSESQVILNSVSKPAVDDFRLLNQFNSHVSIWITAGPFDYSVTVSRSWLWVITDFQRFHNSDLWNKNHKNVENVSLGSLPIDANRKWFQNKTVGLWKRFPKSKEFNYTFSIQRKIYWIFWLPRSWKISFTSETFYLRVQKFTTGETMRKSCH